MGPDPGKVFHTSGTIDWCAEVEGFRADSNFYKF